ncbi:MAG: DinB family protein [Bacteroidota bacterium]
MTYASLLRQILAQFQTILPTVPVADLEAKPDPDRWSHKEILGHLIDSAHNNHQRFLRAEAQSNLIFQGYAQEEWVRLNRYQERSLEEIVGLLLAMNEHIAVLVEGLSPEALQQETREHNFHQIGMNPVEAGSPASLRYLIWDYLFHLEHHLSQVFPSYRKLLEPFT